MGRKAKGICKTKGCKKKVLAKGLCSTCYWRIKSRERYAKKKDGSKQSSRQIVSSLKPVKRKSTGAAGGVGADSFADESEIKKIINENESMTDGRRRIRSSVPFGKERKIIVETVISIKVEDVKFIGYEEVGKK